MTDPHNLQPPRYGVIKRTIGGSFARSWPPPLPRRRRCCVLLLLLLGLSAAAAYNRCAALASAVCEFRLLHSACVCVLPYVPVWGREYKQYLNSRPKQGNHKTNDSLSEAVQLSSNPSPFVWNTSPTPEQSSFRHEIKTRPRLAAGVQKAKLQTRINDANCILPAT